MLHIIKDKSPWGAPDPETGDLNAVYLDALLPAASQVGFGTLGKYGQLGYEGGRTVVCGRDVLHGLSAHAPSRLRYELAGKYSEFRTTVGVADDAVRFRTRCTFIVRIDGMDSCEPVTITAGASPRLITLGVRAARWMELVVSSDRFEHAHSVWIDPQLVPMVDAGFDRPNPTEPNDATSSQANQAHTLNLHGNLGDHAALTGVPYAYWKAMRRRLLLTSDRPEFRSLWARNPYCDLVESPVGNEYSVRFEDYGVLEDWKCYRPQRIFTELTGMAITPERVSPALYYDRAPHNKRLVVCDQASWENRRGYPYLNGLLVQLRNRGWEIIYLRNTNMSERQVHCEHIMMKLNLIETIEFMNTASLFVGYDSGLAHIAAGLNVPSVQFAGSTPPRVFKHSNCIYCLEACHHCCTDQCLRNCLTACGDDNDTILSAIAAHFQEAK